MSQVSKKTRGERQSSGENISQRKTNLLFGRPQTPERTPKRQKNNTEAKFGAHHVPVSRWQKIFGFNLKKTNQSEFFEIKIGKFLLVEKNRVR